MDSQPHTAHPLKGSAKLFMLGIFSLVGYIHIFLLAGQLPPRGADDFYITRFLQTYFLIFLCYWFLIAPLLRGKRMDPRHVWFAIGFALLFRAILLPTPLILENDIYRYMWDGHMIHEGINPYRYPPNDAHLDAYDTGYRDRINYSYIRTIYPPTLQGVFFIADFLYPDRVTGMKFILLIFDLGTIFLLLSLLRYLDLPQEWCLVYAWSPLVIKEIANSGHADSVSAFLLAAFLWLVVRSYNQGTSLCLALLTLTKFFGLLLLPLLHRLWHWKHYLIFILFIVVMYLPFISTFDVNPFSGFITYSQNWQFNAGIFELVEWGLDSMGGKVEENADRLARLLLMAVILIVTAWQTIMLLWKPSHYDFIRAVFIVMGTLLICSPVIDPWYMVWIVPLLCIRPNRAWILLTGLIYLSYTYYYNLEFAAWVKPTEYILFFLILLWDVCFKRFRFGVVSNDAQDDVSIQTDGSHV